MSRPEEPQEKHPERGDTNNNNEDDDGDEEDGTGGGKGGPKIKVARPLAEKIFSPHMMSVYDFMQLSPKKQQACVQHVRPLDPESILVFPEQTAKQLEAKLKEVTQRQNPTSDNGEAAALAERLATFLCEAIIHDEIMGFKIWGVSCAPTRAEAGQIKYFRPLSRKHQAVFHAKGFDANAHRKDEPPDLRNQSHIWQGRAFTTIFWDPRYIINKWIMSLKAADLPRPLPDAPADAAPAEVVSKPPRQRKKTQKAPAAATEENNETGGPIPPPPVVVPPMVNAEPPKPLAPAKPAKRGKASEKKAGKTPKGDATADYPAFFKIKAEYTRRATAAFPRVLPLLDEIEDRYLTMDVMQRMSFFPDAFRIDIQKIESPEYLTRSRVEGWESAPLVAALLVRANIDLFVYQGIQRFVISHDNRGVNGTPLRSDTVNRAIDKWAMGPIAGAWDIDTLGAELYMAASLFKVLASAHSVVLQRHELYIVAELMERLLRWRPDTHVPEGGRTCILTGEVMPAGTPALAVDVLLRKAYLPPGVSARAYTCWIKPRVHAFALHDTAAPLATVDVPAAAPAEGPAKQGKKRKNSDAPTAASEEPAKKRAKTNASDPAPVEAETWDVVPYWPNHIVHRDARWHALANQRRNVDAATVAAYRTGLAMSTTKALMMWMAAMPHHEVLALADVIFLFIRPASEHPATPQAALAVDTMEVEAEDDLLMALIATKKKPSHAAPLAWSLPAEVAAFDVALNKLRSTSDKSRQSVEEARQGQPHLGDILKTAADVSKLEPSHPAFAAWEALFAW